MSAQTETQETEAQSDGPLLDLTDAGVKKFIKQAKARGYVTMEDPVSYTHLTLPTKRIV